MQCMLFTFWFLNVLAHNIILRDLKTLNREEDSDTVEGSRYFLGQRYLCAFFEVCIPWFPPFSPPLPSGVQILKQNMHWAFDPINNLTTAQYSRYPNARHGSQVGKDGRRGVELLKRCGLNETLWGVRWSSVYEIVARLALGFFSSLTQTQKPPIRSPIGDVATCISVFIGLHQHLVSSCSHRSTTCGCHFLVPIAAGGHLVSFFGMFLQHIRASPLIIPSQ